MPDGQVNSTQTGAIVTSISAAGDEILYSGVISGNALACSGGSTCFLNNRSTGGIGIALDAAGNAYIAGNTNTTNLPTTPNTLSPNGIGAFVARVNVGGTGLGFLTYLGSGVFGTDPYISADTTLRAIAVDAAGNAYLAGQTNDSKFPTTPDSFQPVFNAGRLQVKSARLARGFCGEAQTGRQRHGLGNLPWQWKRAGAARRWFSPSPFLPAEIFGSPDWPDPPPFRTPMDGPTQATRSWSN